MMLFRSRRMNVCLLAALSLVSFALPVSAAANDVPARPHVPLAMVLDFGLADAALLLILSLGGVVTYGVRRWHWSRFQTALDKLESCCSSVSERLKTLESKDTRCYLSHHRSWMRAFRTATVTHYSNIVSNVRTLKARVHALRGRIRQARLELEKGGEVPTVGAMRRALKLLKKEQFQFSLKTLPDGKPVQFEEKPAELADMCYRTIGVLEKQMAELLDAINACQTAQNELAAADEALQTEFAGFVSDGFASDSYQQELAVLQDELAAFLESRESDPFGAARAAKELAEQFQQLQDELKERRACKRELESAVQVEISQLEERIEAVRSQAVVYGLPCTVSRQSPVDDGSPDEPEPEDGADATTFKLQEPGHNPDDCLAQARERTAEAIRLVLLAPRREEIVPVEKGRKARRGTKENRPEPGYVACLREARNAVTQGLEKVDETLASKATIDRESRLYFASVEALREQLESCRPVRETLEAEHAESSWQEEAQNLRAAESATGEFQFAQVMQAYLDQHFFEALRLLQELQANVNEISTALTKLESRLKQLQKHRKRAKECALTLRQKLDALTGKLDGQSTSAASQTAFAIEALQERVGELEATVELAVTDWSAADEQGGQIGAELVDLDAALDQQKVEHEKALSRLEALASLVADAERATSGDCTRRAGRTRVAEAKREHKRLSGAMEEAGSNWAQLSAEIEEAKKVAREAAKFGNDDKAAYDRASRLLAQAQQKQKRLGRFAVGPDISDKMRVANQALADAQARFEERAWEEAERLAYQADTSYRGALNARGW